MDKPWEKFKDRFRFGHHGFLSWLCRVVSLHAVVIPERGLTIHGQRWHGYRCLCGRAGGNKFGSSKEYS